MCISNRHRVYWTSVGLLVVAIALGAPRTAPADQCIPDDLVVDGSLNIGFDSICNRNFGFDTLVLSENNLRIFFEDTSNSASFPTNDWRIVINDTSNGGANFFAIEDTTAGRQPFRVTAGARANALFVDSAGRIGIGTSTPAVQVEVVNGNTPTVRLRQDGSSGFTPQTWDVAGNEVSFFIRDATNGSALPFRIAPGTPSQSLFIRSNEITFNEGGTNQDLRIEGDTNANLFFVDASTDKIGIGTNTPTANLQVVQSGTPITASAQTVASFQRGGDTIVSIIANNANNSVLDFGDTDSAVVGRVDYDHATNVMQFRTNGTDNRLVIDNAGFVGLGVAAPTFPFVVGTNNTNGNGAHVTAGGMFLNGSSREFKENIREVAAAEARDAVMSLKPVTYNYKLEPDEQYAGFIAEDVPELVATNSRQYLSPMDIVSVVTKVVQDQQETIAALSQRIAQLERQSQTKD